VLSHLGKTLAGLDRNDEAIAALKQSLKLGGNRVSSMEAADIQALLGKVLAGTGHREMGQIHLESSLKLNPRHGEASRILADIAREQGRSDDALANYLVAVDSYPDDKNILVELGVLLNDKQDYQRAKGYFERAIKMDQSHARAHEGLGIALANLHDAAKGRAELAQALALDPMLADSQFHLGELARAQGDEEQALAHYYAALKIDPEHPRANTRLGDYFVRKEKFGSGIRHFRTALKRTPDDKRLTQKIQYAEKLKETVKAEAM
jgi:tetratricopeptide (TPR) repeat protein